MSDDYTGHVKCHKCGTFHWMFGQCPDLSPEEGTQIQSINNKLEEFVKKYALRVHDLNEMQLAEVIRQAIPDFQKLITPNGQTFSYIPFLEANRWKELYFELLYSVETVYEGETRHQTALRYIQNCEKCHGESMELTS